MSDITVKDNFDAAPPASAWRDFWRIFLRNKVAVIALAIVLVIALLAIFAPFLTPRKDSVASSEIAEATCTVATTISGGSEFGKMCRVTTNQPLIGMESAACT